MGKPRKRSVRRGRRRQLNILQSLFFIVVLVSAGYILLRSSFFAVAEIRVEGLRTLQAGEIQRLSGVNLGENTFKVNLKAVQARVAMNPLVKKAEVRRSYPRAIVISVEERQPVALLPWKGEYLAVDPEGYYLSVVRDFTQANLPLITGIRLGNLTPGKQISSEGLTASLKYLNGMGKEEIAKLSEINGSDPQGIIMYTLDGIEVRLGGVERTEEKLAILRETLNKHYSRKVEYINITFVGKPVIKFAGSTISAAAASNTPGKD